MTLDDTLVDGESLTEKVFTAVTVVERLCRFVRVGILLVDGDREELVDTVFDALFPAEKLDEVENVNRGVGIVEDDTRVDFDKAALNVGTGVDERDAIELSDKK